MGTGLAKSVTNVLEERRGHVSVKRDSIAAGLGRRDLG
jgi:hypothetical protein